MKNLEQLLKKLLRSDVNSRQNNPYSKIGVVRERYVLEEEVNNNRISTSTSSQQKLLRDKVVNDIISQINAINVYISNNLLGRRAGISPNVVTNAYGNISFPYECYQPYTYDTILKTKTVLGNVSNTKGIGFRYAGREFQTVTYTVTAMRILPPMFESTKNYILSQLTVLDKVSYEEVLMVYEETARGFMIGIEVLQIDPTAPQDVDNSVKPLFYAKKPLVDSYLVQVREGYYKVIDYVPVNTVTNQTVTTTDIFNKNSVTIEILDDKDFDLGNPLKRNFIYDSKTSANPGNTGIIKIPKEGSYVIGKKTSNENMFIEVTTEYNEIQVTIDNGLKAKIKDYIASFIADEMNLITGTDLTKPQLRGLSVKNNSLTTVNLNYILLQGDNGYIEIDKDIDIIGTNSTLIGIGRAALDDEFTTPYDNYIDELSKEFEAYKSIITEMKSILSIQENNFRYSLYDPNKRDTGYEDRINNNNSISSIILAIENFNDITYTETNISIVNNDFAVLWNNVADMKRILRLFTEQNIKEKKLVEKPTVNFQSDLQTIANTKASLLPQLSIPYNSIVNRYDLTFADNILQTVTVKKYPYSNERLRGTEGVGIYQLMDRIKILYNTLYLDLLNRLSIPNWIGTKDVDRRVGYSIYNVGYVSPEDATGLVVIYILYRFTLIEKALQNNIDLRNDYLANREPSQLKDSLGNILRDMLNSLIGGVKMFQPNPTSPFTPPYIDAALPPLSGVNEIALDNKLKAIETRVNNLLR